MADNGTILKLFKGVYIDDIPVTNSDVSSTEPYIWRIEDNLLQHGIRYQTILYNLQDYSR